MTIQNDLLPPQLSLEALLKTEEAPSPLKILIDQGELLQNRLEGLVGARLEGTIPTSEGSTCFAFVLYATSMHFNFQLFTIELGIAHYPLLLGELEKFELPDGNDSRTVQTQPEFEALLKEIFVSRKFLQIVRSLVEQSKLIQSQAA